jgi:hypothetical protein
MKNLLFVLFIIITSSAFSQTQKNNKSIFTIEQIMQDPDKWIGTSPDNISWDEQSSKIYFEWNPDKDTLTSIYSYNLKTKKTKKVFIEEKRKMAGRNSDYNSNKTKKVYISGGNLYLLDIEKGVEKQLTGWFERISSPKFVLNDSEISFLKDNNLFCINPETGLIRQITNFVQGEDKPESKTKGQDLYLENQQKELFEVLRQREAKEKASEYNDEKEKTKEPEKIYLGKKRVGNVSLSPSGKFVVYTTYVNPQGSKQTSVTHFVTESGYTEEKSGRTKVGSTQTEIEMGIFDVENNKTVKINTTAIPGLKDLPGYLKDYPDKCQKTVQK